MEKTKETKVKDFSIRDNYNTRATYSSWSKPHQNKYASTLRAEEDIELDVTKVLSQALRGSLRIPSVSDLSKASLLNDVKISDLREQSE